VGVQTALPLQSAGAVQAVSTQALNHVPWHEHVNSTETHVSPVGQVNPPQPHWSGGENEVVVEHWSDGV
jgi:hypothetical protein